MNDSDLHQGLRDYYESITPADSVRATTLVAAAIRAKRERSEKSRRWRPAFAAAAALAIVAALVALPFVFRPAALPNASSSPPATMSYSLPPASASPSPAGDWKLLAASVPAYEGASWSSDGKWLVVWEEYSGPVVQDMRLLDGTGNVVRSLDGDSFLWLDPTQFVISRGTSSFLGSVGSTVLTPLAATFPAGAPSNNHGAVAVTTVQPLDPAKTSFVVWTQAGTSRVVIGEPEAWSPDGTRLAIWHSTAPAGPRGIGSQDTGWVEVLSWPDLRSVASIKDDLLVSVRMSFDPSSRYLLLPRIGFAGSLILDLATGRTVGPSGVNGPTVWDSSSDLLVTATDGSVTRYPISGGPAVTEAGVGDSVASSTDGSTIVLYFSQDYSSNPRPITLIRNGVARAIAVPGGLESDPVIAADGSGVVIRCLVHHGLPSEETETLLLVG